MPKYLDQTGLARYHGNIEKRPVQTFDTVAAMQAATWLKAGMTCHTNGFHASGDGGAAYYTIGTTGTANGMDVLALQDGLYATLVITDAYVTPEQFGAYGNGTHDDSAAMSYTIAHAFSNHLSVNLASKKYILSGNNPMGLQYVAGESDISILNGLFSGRDSYNLNLNGAGAWIVWTPENEDDCLAFVGYLRKSEWSDFRITVNSANHYGDILSTHFGVANQSHYFSKNVFRNIAVDGNFRRFISFYCGDDGPTHDDLSLFEEISCSGHKTFYYTDNSNSVSNTFNCCTTLIESNNAVDFHIACSEWHGMMRVLNHHFTINGSDGSVFFQIDAAENRDRYIVVENPRVEIKGGATNWKYFIIHGCNLILNRFSTVTYAPYSSAAIYGDVYSGGQVIIKDSLNVYTPLAVHTTSSTQLKQALVLLNNTYQDGNTINKITLAPRITYIDSSGTVLSNRLAAIQSGEYFPNIRIANEYKHAYLYYYAFPFDIQQENSSLCAWDASKKVCLTSKSGNYQIVNRNNSYQMPSELKITSIKYYANNNQAMDIHVNVNSTQVASGNLAQSSNVWTSAELLANPLYVKSNDLLNFTFYAAGTSSSVTETALGVTNSYVLIEYEPVNLLADLAQIYTV